MTGKSPPPASPPLFHPPSGGGLVSSLAPDIDVTRRAIERLVFSLSGDPEEQVEIIAKAAFGTLILMMGTDMAAAVFRAVADGRLFDFNCAQASIVRRHPGDDCD